MTTRQLLNNNATTTPSYTWMGPGFCANGQGSNSYTSVYCKNCEASVSHQRCSSSCWDFHKNYLTPFLSEEAVNGTLTTLGFQISKEYCVCLLDANHAANWTADLLMNLNHVAEEEGFGFHFGDIELGPIAGSDGTSGWSCFVNDDPNETNNHDDYPSAAPSSPDDNRARDQHQPGSCRDHEGYRDISGDGCLWYMDHGCLGCDGFANHEGVSACEACCVCGGGDHQLNDGDPSTHPENENHDGFIAIAAAIGFVAIAACIVLKYCRGNSTAPVAPAATADGTSDNAETQQQQRDKFEAKLAATSMVVSKQDLIATDLIGPKLDGNHLQATAPIMETEDDEDNVVEVDIELGDNDDNDAPVPLAESSRFDSENTHVQCAICLSSFQVGDAVSWAATNDENTTTASKCQHAFHTSCIVKFAEFNTRNSTSTTVKCPLCRQVFVS